MATHTASTQIRTRDRALPTRQQWILTGLVTALVAIVLVLMTEALALATWPEIATFKPLDSYPRTVLFTLVPTVIATILFARLARTRQDPVSAFVKIAVVVLLVSFIPDYVLPVPNRTFLSSSVAGLMHLVAGIVITAGLVIGYKQAMKNF